MLKFELPNKERPFEVIFVCFLAHLAIGHVSFCHG